MTRYLCAIILLLVLALTVSPAWSQDDFIIINSEVIKSHERPLVVFPHEKHGSIIECGHCHHDLNEYLVNVGGSETRCSECHTAKGSSENSVPLMKAFHGNCKGCHQKLLDRRRTSGPVMCGRCHVRGKTIPE